MDSLEGATVALKESVVVSGADDSVTNTFEDWDSLAEPLVSLFSSSFSSPG